MAELTSYIGGAWRHGPGEATLDLNPANPSEVVATVSQADAQMVNQAVEAAARAAAGWSALPSPARGDVLRRAGRLIEERAESIARDFTREEGKTFNEALGETLRAAAIFHYFSAQALDPDGQTFPSSAPATFLYSRREPLGVVALITPWNFPIAIPAWKLAPALVFGNAVVWKPADLVPLTSVHLVTALTDAGLPPGVLNLVLGRGSVVGDVLTQHPLLRAISFTGSTPVGRSIERKAVPLGKSVQLEMGGKNPAVVLADADLDLAAEAVGRAAFLSAGQKCTATSRVIVAREVFDEFAELLAALARSWRVGDPFDELTKVGPLASKEQLDTVLGYLDIAKEDGATARAGGGRVDELGDGYYIPLTVFSDLPPSSRVVTEEIFGPVVSLIPATSFEDAVSQANDTPFGLSASCFTRDLDKAFRFARESRTGIVKINQESTNMEIHAPFGGLKDSSAGGREQGKAARHFFTESKTIYITHGGTA